MKLFVRIHSFKDDNYSSFWSGSDHAWGNLRSATVFTETEVKSFTRLPIRQSLDAPITGYHTSVRLDRGGDYYVPGEGEWQELPEVLGMRTPAELDAERERSYGDDDMGIFTGYGEYDDRYAKGGD